MHTWDTETKEVYIGTVSRGNKNYTTSGVKKNAHIHVATLIQTQQTKETKLNKKLIAKRIHIHRCIVKMSEVFSGHEVKL